MSGTNDLLAQALMPIIGAKIDEAINNLGISKEQIESKIDEAISSVATNSTKLISVSVNNSEPINIGLAHKQFELITKIVASGANLMITGQAGNSKSHTLSQVAKALNLPFHSMSVSMQTTKTDLLGFVDANGNYRYNGFVTAFRDGGIFNLDEIDAGNPNVLVVLNSAISNGFVELPNGEMVYKHENFRMTATANTFGTGANTKYVGRNKLDSATLDRFAVVHFEIDEELEEKLCGDKDIARGFRAMRKVAEKSFEDIMITMRSCIGTSKLVSAGLGIDDALKIHCYKGIDEDAKKALSDAFFKEYKQVTSTFTVEKPSENKCPDCKNGDLIMKEGRYGKFIGCTNYPICNHTEKVDTKSSIDDDPFNY